MIAEAGADQVTGADFSTNMLKQANKRKRSHRDPAAAKRVTFVEADALKLPFEDNTFDAVTVSFGVRNVENIGVAFEIYSGQPTRSPHRFSRNYSANGRIASWFYNVWFDRIVPTLGKLVAKDSSAYTYLPASTKFPKPPELAKIMRSSGVDNL